MKFLSINNILNNGESRPARALWIEIHVCVQVHLDYVKSRPARALWIEIAKDGKCKRMPESRPARALWIEIL